MKRIINLIVMSMVLAAVLTLAVGNAYAGFMFPYDAQTVDCQDMRNDTGSKAGTCFIVDGQIYRINSVFHLKTLPVLVFLETLSPLIQKYTVIGVEIDPDRLQQMSPLVD